jgi:putative ATP-dependent endonuclease of OLD family
MQITRVRIRNFRCIEDVAFDLSSTPVLVGENNVGKTAILDAIKLTMSRRWGRSGVTGFNEYDFRCITVERGKEYLPIEIYLEFEETDQNRWPQDIKDALLGVTNTDPVTGLDRIALRVTCTFEEASKEVEPTWQFINREGEPFQGGARRQNTNAFFDHVRFFSMAALRDAAVEFGPRSRLWASLLKTVNIDAELTQEFEEQFAQLNDQLLKADPKLGAIKGTLGAISSVVAVGAAGDVDLRAMPTNLWEVLSRAELIIQGRADDPWLPIERHGHGVQSLAVIFLFKAFVENALSEEAETPKYPILALEEPEGHLHPQASRSLWLAINSLPGQKLVTTHSPYFAQNVPLDQIVLVRRDEGGTCVSSIARSYEVPVAQNEELVRCANGLGDGVSYNADTQILTGRREISQDEFRRLLECFPGEDRAAPHVQLRAFYDAGRRHLSNEDLFDLERFARRIRGEIFFARKWLLCEGQSDYAILSATAEILGCPTDAYSIAIIDYQNNGSAGVFAAAARTLGVPWAMICDGDDAGDRHIDQLRSRHFGEAEIGLRVTQIPKPAKLEGLLVASPLRPIFLAAVRELDPNVPDEDQAIIATAESSKEEAAVRMAARMRADAVADQIPLELKRPFVALGEVAGDAA